MHHHPFQTHFCYFPRLLSYDRWSGQVAFPGGRRDGLEPPLATAVREVSEEVGLALGPLATPTTALTAPAAAAVTDAARALQLRQQELSESPIPIPSQSQEQRGCPQPAVPGAAVPLFALIGRLPDRDIDPHKQVKPLTVGTFVFLQLCPATPPLALDAREVAGVLWAPLRLMAARDPWETARLTNSNHLNTNPNNAVVNPKFRASSIKVQVNPVVVPRAAAAAAARPTAAGSIGGRGRLSTPTALALSNTDYMRYSLKQV